MEIIQEISDSITGLHREVYFIRLIAERNQYLLQMEIKCFKLENDVKKYLPVSIPCSEFITSNNRRMLPNETGAISLFNENEEGWESAIPETLFYDHLIQSNTVSLPDLIRSAILNLDSERWNWFKEE